MGRIREQSKDLRKDCAIQEDDSSEFAYIFGPFDRFIVVLERSVRLLAP